MSTSLGRAQGASPMSPEEIERAAAAAYHRRACLMAWLDDHRLSPQERALLDRIGAKLYGPRVCERRDRRC